MSLSGIQTTRFSLSPKEREFENWEREIGDRIGDDECLEIIMKKFLQIFDVDIYRR
jgi:hypothetical protein